MKKLLLFCAIISALMLSSCNEQQGLKSDLKKALKVAIEQNKQQAERMLEHPNKFPRTYENGEVKFTDVRGWVSGFFPGSLWLLYEHTGDKELKAYAEKYHREVDSISSAAQKVLLSHCWSGNVRELQNCIEKAVILSDGAELMPDDIQLQIVETQISVSQDLETLDEVEERAIRSAMTKHEGNLSLVAKALNISRPTLYAKLKKYGI